MSFGLSLSCGTSRGKRHLLTRHEANASRGPKEELGAEEQLPDWSLKCSPGGEGAAGPEEMDGARAAGALGAVPRCGRCPRWF